MAPGDSRGSSFEDGDEVMSWRRSVIAKTLTSGKGSIG